MEILECRDFDRWSSHLSVPRKITLRHLCHIGIMSSLRCLTPAHLQRGKLEQSHRFDMLDLLDNLKDCECSDLRDRIYVLLGMCADKPVVVDYNQSVEQVFTALARSVLYRPHNRYRALFDGLDTVYGPSADLSLPSWVPNWRTMGLSTRNYCKSTAVLGLSISAGYAEDILIDNAAKYSTLLDRNCLIEVTSQARGDQRQYRRVYRGKCYLNICEKVVHLAKTFCYLLLDGTICRYYLAIACKYFQTR